MPVLLPLTIGLVGAAGGMFAGRRLGPKPSTAGQQAQAATPPQPTTTPVTPPSTTETTSDSYARAGEAAARVRRRRMQAGAGSTSPAQLPGHQRRIRAAVEPRTAVGY